MNKQKCEFLKIPPVGCGSFKKHNYQNRFSLRHCRPLEINYLFHVEAQLNFRSVRIVHETIPASARTSLRSYKDRSRWTLTMQININYDAKPERPNGVGHSRGEKGKIYVQWKNVQWEVLVRANYTRSELKRCLPAYFKLFITVGDGRTD